MIGVGEAGANERRNGTPGLALRDGLLLGGERGKPTPLTLEHAVAAVIHRPHTDGLLDPDALDGRQQPSVRLDVLGPRVPLVQYHHLRVKLDQFAQVAQNAKRLYRSVLRVHDGSLQ